MELPMHTKSRTDNDDPKRDMPNTESADPKRTYPRNADARIVGGAEGL